MWIKNEIVFKGWMLAVRNLHHGIPHRQKVISDTDIFKTFIKENVPSQYEASVLEDWKILKKRKPSHEEKKCISMLLPPPNITGHLHLGHVLTVSIQDVLARWYHMLGYDVVWLPGTDHAGIATQVVVEKILQKKGISRFDLGRETFVKKVQEWKANKGSHITDQLRHMGLTLDWSREFFTMDEHQAYAVRHAIIQLFEDGLLYKENALVNWCCTLNSTISDIEVDHVHVSGKTKLTVPGYQDAVTFGQMYNIAYRVCDSSEELIVSTTRPETILGDVALAVHPEDSRYFHLHNARVQHPLHDAQLPVVLDESVKIDFGTGVLKVTPAHDRRDFEISKRHNLPRLVLFTDDGRLSVACAYKGLKRFEAREEIVKELEHRSLLRGITEHEMLVPVCSRTGDVIELMLKPQWFVNCKDMGVKVLESLQSGQLSIDPANHVPAWNKWFENSTPWCVSRQLWWGHQLPLYQCEQGYVAAHNLEEARHKAKLKWGENVSTLHQEQDVLDTWFSSALLPFSSLGWPRRTQDFLDYYPLSFMETGHDILCFWVARMVMLGIFFTGKVPFPKVILHGMVCDGQNRKMSKSLGNTVEPEYIVNGVSLKDLNQITKANLDSGLLSSQEYETSIKAQKLLYPQGIMACGSDALRFTLVQQPAKNVTVHFDVDACVLNKRFGNKILNLAKFTCCNAELLNMTSVPCMSEVTATSIPEQWILSRLASTVVIVNSSLVEVDLHLAARSLKQFLYEDMCDIFVELSKPMLSSDDDVTKMSAGKTLVVCLETSLRLMSPFMPFLMHVLYKYLPARGDHAVSECSYPLEQEWTQWINKDLEQDMSLVLRVVSVIRKITSVNNISGKAADVIILSSDQSTLNQYSTLMSTLVRVKSILIKQPGEQREEESQFSFSDTVGQNTSVHVIVNNSDKSATQHEKLLSEKRARLKKEIEKLDKKTKKEKNEVKRDGFVNKLNSLHVELNELDAFLLKAKNS